MLNNRLRLKPNLATIVVLAAVRVTAATVSRSLKKAANLVQLSKPWLMMMVKIKRTITGFLTMHTTWRTLSVSNMVMN